jgi:hypothetical protein
MQGKRQQKQIFSFGYKNKEKNETQFPFYQNISVVIPWI